MQLKHYVAWRLSALWSMAILVLCWAASVVLVHAVRLRPRQVREGLRPIPRRRSEGGLTADPPPPDGSVPLEYSNGNLGELVIVSSTLAAEK